MSMHQEQWEASPVGRSQPSTPLQAKSQTSSCGFIRSTAKTTRPPRIIHVHHESRRLNSMPAVVVYKKILRHSGGLSVPGIHRRFIIDLMKAPEV